MSPDAARYFADGIRNSCQPGFVHDFLQSQLPRILERRVRGWPDHDCLLAELGDFLVAVMDITSDVAQGLVIGGHISEYASSRGPLLTPDLSTSDYLEEKHEALV
ncbi:hypothetical protein S40285_10492 [Stachybotrys chlorohalonatus IBT 40285]|uniref:Uncharacterized protein n=1 Tax=Stachybotrys chlorohalonatus (strain IBT 40285) TaxID=1283841 RepID=A0A084R013_STAC4|nr:hypothetical protein S40285_10492 [Stachybotrys chlorohalonata IBT 40285]